MTGVLIVLSAALFVVIGLWLIRAGVIPEWFFELIEPGAIEMETEDEGTSGLDIGYTPDSVSLMDLRSISRLGDAQALAEHMFGVDEDEVTAGMLNHADELHSMVIFAGYNEQNGHREMKVAGIDVLGDFFPVQPEDLPDYADDFMPDSKKSDPSCNKGTGSSFGCEACSFEAPEEFLDQLMTEDFDRMVIWRCPECSSTNVVRGRYSTQRRYPDDITTPYAGLSALGESPFDYPYRDDVRSIPRYFWSREALQ